MIAIESLWPCVTALERPQQRLRLSRYRVGGEFSFKWRSGSETGRDSAVPKRNDQAWQQQGRFDAEADDAALE